MGATTHPRALGLDMEAKKFEVDGEGKLDGKRRAEVEDEPIGRNSEQDWAIHLTTQYFEASTTPNRHCFHLQRGHVKLLGCISSPET